MDTVDETRGEDGEKVASSLAAAQAPGAAAGTALAVAEPLQPMLAAIEIEDRERVDRYMAKASADETLRAYTSDWKLFKAWCAGRHVSALPASPETVARYLTDLAENGTERTKGVGLSKASIGRRLAAIVYAHRVNKVEPPTSQVGAVDLERVVRGIRRDKKGKKPGKKRAADGDVLRDMLRAITGNELRDARDRALLAIGMAGAFRRSELVAIQVGDITEVAEGLKIHIPFSKADQDGEGADVVIPDRRRIAPVQLYRDWIAAAAISDGPVFRKLTPQGRLTAKAMSDRGVALVVKARVIAAGYPPEAFSGHSLRAGFLTEAGRQGANPFKMKEHSRHGSLEMVSEYVRDHERFRDHAGDRFL